MFIFPNKPIRIYDIPKLLATQPSNWLVQEKMDGKRVHPFCDAEGKVILYGRQGQVFKEEASWLAELPFPRPWLLDGELMRDGRMFFWDYAIWGGKEVYRELYINRLSTLQKLFIPIKTANLVQTLPAHEFQEILKHGKKDGLEGVVFKNPIAIDLWGITSTSEVPSMFKYRL